MPKLSGKVAVVSGASKGIGAAVAEKLAENGAAVVVNYSTSAGPADAVVDRIRAAGGTAKAVRADVSRPEEAARLIQTAVSEFGKVDIHVNNAGIYEFRPLPQVDEQHFDRLFGLNVKGLLFATRAAANAFDGRGGSVINISSVASQLAMPNTSVYSATKAAVDALTRTLAAELGPRKILVNAILPGPVETEGVRAMPGWNDVKSYFLPRTALGRIGRPEDIANVVVFLASDEAGWITGQVIPAAGGLN
jgi:3-oxoacyl-[acyl-carrier protein] reductase